MKIKFIKHKWKIVVDLKMNKIILKQKDKSLMTKYYYNRDYAILFNIKTTLRMCEYTECRKCSYMLDKNWSIFQALIIL